MQAKTNREISHLVAQLRDVQGRGGCIQRGVRLLRAIRIRQRDRREHDNFSLHHGDMPQSKTFKFLIDFR